MKDKITKLNENLKEIKEKFEALQALGVDKEILIAWIKYKTNSAKGTIEKMLDAQEEFYQKLIKEEMLKKMDEDERETYP